MSSPQPAAKAPGPRRSGVVVPERARRADRVAALAVYVLVRGLDATLRYQLENPSGSLAQARATPVIFAIWHNRLALSLMLYRRYVQRGLPARRMAAMVSASRDGGLLARVLEHFGVEPVRGSSSRRGPQAVLEMTSWAGRGFDLAITPDGPRGPSGVVQEGVLAVAQVTGLPILPVSYQLQWKYRAKSWDRFQIPMPFSCVTVRLGALLRVPRETAEPQREQARLDLEHTLRELSGD